MKRKMFAILSIAVTLVFCMSLTFNSLAVTESDKKNLQDKINFFRCLLSMLFNQN